MMESIIAYFRSDKIAGLWMSFRIDIMKHMNQNMAEALTKNDHILGKNRLSAAGLGSISDRLKSRNNQLDFRSKNRTAIKTLANRIIPNHVLPFLAKYTAILFMSIIRHIRPATQQKNCKLMYKLSFFPSINLTEKR